MTDKPDESSKKTSSTPTTTEAEINTSKKTAAKKPTVKKSAAPKKTVAKKAAPKKAPAKKIAAKKEENSSSKENKPAVKNKRMGTSSGRRNEDRVMPGLLQNLQGVFDKIHHDNRDQDRARDYMARDFNVNMQRSFKTMHKELEEREKLLDRKLKSIDSSHSHEIQRVKLMSVPIMILTLVAIVYLFYVVRVMETAMTSMSQDMKHMTHYMETITQDTHALSINTESMVTSVDNMNTEIAAVNQNVGQLNATVNNMMVDVHHMTRTVAPAMQGINRFMP